MVLTRRAALGGLLAAPAIRAARAAEPVTYLFPAPSFLPAFVPHQLAMERGYFAAAGLAVTFQTGRGGADAAKQVAVGNADLGGGVGETAMIVRPNGLPVRGVALLGGRSLYQLASRKPAGIHGPADLRGKKVGVIGYQDTSYYALLGVLAAAGVKRDELEVQSLGPAGMTQLMIAGSVDAIMAVPEWSFQIEKAGVPLDRLAIDSLFPSMSQAVLASDTIIAKRPAVVRGFVAAILHAMHDCIDDPAAAARDYVTAVPQQAGKAADIETILRRYVTDVYPVVPPLLLGQFDPKRLATVQRFYVDNKIIETAVPIGELYTNAFVG
jgi:NitT/TauT family transport system substrate-binding protein